MSDRWAPVVYLDNGYGDHLLALPALRALSQHFGGRLRLLCGPGAWDTFFSDVQFERVLEVPSKTTGTIRSFDADRAAKAIGACGLFISLNTWHSFDVDRLLSLLAPVHSVGYFGSFRSRIRLDLGKHSADLLFDIAQEFDASLRIEDFDHPPRLAPADVDFADRIRDMVPPPLHVLAVHPETLPHKMLPIPRLVASLDAFLERNTDVLVFDVSRQPLGLDCGHHGVRVIPCTGRSLTEAMALVACADFFLGIDSCMLHAADLFRIPGVALFGPTSPREWGFRFSPHHHHITGNGTMEAIEDDRIVRCLHEVAGRRRMETTSNVRCAPQN
jgi:ADP-heptose:LPS heptosyltransferase